MKNAKNGCFLIETIPQAIDSTRVVWTNKYESYFAYIFKHNDIVNINA